MQQHLACPFSYVLLDFVMVCEGVAVYLTFRLFPGEATATLGYSPCPRKQWPSACQRWKLSTWSRALPKKPTGPQLVINFPVSYGSRSFITAFRNPATCPCPESDQFHPCPLSHFLKIHLNIILPSVPRCSKWSLSFRSPNQNLIFNSPLLYT